MNYELALELREAGFPLKFVLFHDLQQVDGAPTLEELIEACGNGLQSLINNREEGWIAFTNRKDETGVRMEISGATPTEAMARLWLVINKKDTTTV